MAPCFSSGDKALVLYGPLIYNAKVLDSRQGEDGKADSYLVHYLQWSKKWDEWVDAARIMEVSEENLAKQAHLLAAFESAEADLQQNSSLPFHDNLEDTASNPDTKMKGKVIQISGKSNVSEKEPMNGSGYGEGWSTDEDTEELVNGKMKQGGAGTAHTCGICLDEIWERGVLDCCAHMYCFSCIQEWATVANLCPLCKRRFRFISRLPLSGHSQMEASVLPSSVLVDERYHAACVGFDTNNSSNAIWICPRCTAQPPSQRETETGFPNSSTQSGVINQRDVNQSEPSMDTFAINNSRDILSPTQTLGSIAAAVANLLGSRNILDLHFEAREETSIGEGQQLEAQRDTRESPVGERTEETAQDGSRRFFESREKIENVDGSFSWTQENSVGGNMGIAEEGTSFIEPNHAKTRGMATCEEVKLNDNGETPQEESTKQQGLFSSGTSEALVTTEGSKIPSFGSQGTDEDGGNSERFGGSHIHNVKVNEELRMQSKPNDDQGDGKEEDRAAGQEISSSRIIEEPVKTKLESYISPGQGTNCGSHIRNVEITEDLRIQTKPNEDQSDGKEPREEDPAARQEMASSRIIEEPVKSKQESSISPRRGTNGGAGDLENPDDNTYDAEAKKDLDETGVAEENMDKSNKITVDVEMVETGEEKKQPFMTDELKPVDNTPFAGRPAAVENRDERVRLEGKRKRPQLVSTDWSRKRPSITGGSFKEGDSCSTPGCSLPVRQLADCQLFKSDAGRGSPGKSWATAGAEKDEQQINQQMGSCRWRKILKREDDQEESIGRSVIARIREDRIKAARYGAGQSLEAVDVSDEKFLTAYRGAVARLKEKQRQEEGLVRTGVGQLHGKPSRTSKFGDKVRENLAKKLYARGRGLNTYDRDWDIEFWKRKVLREKAERERASGSSCVAGGSTIQKKVEKTHSLPKKEQKYTSLEKTACQGLQKVNNKGKEEQVDLVELVKENCMGEKGGTVSGELGGAVPITDKRGRKREHTELGDVTVVLKPGSHEEGGEIVNSQQGEASLGAQNQEEEGNVEVKMQEHSMMKSQEEVATSKGKSQNERGLEGEICVGNESLSPEKQLQEKACRTIELSKDSANLLSNLETRDGSLLPSIKLLPEVTPLGVEPEANKNSVELREGTEKTVVHMESMPELQECRAISDIREPEVICVRADSANGGKKTLENPENVSKPEACLSVTPLLECTQRSVSKSTPNAEVKKIPAKNEVKLDEKSGGNNIWVLGNKRTRVSEKATATSVVTPVSTAIVEKRSFEGGRSTVDKEREARRKKAMELLARKGGGVGSHGSKNQKPSVNAKNGGATTSDEKSEFRCLVALPDDMRPIVPLNLRSRVPTPIRQVQSHLLPSSLLPPPSSLLPPPSSLLPPPSSLLPPYQKGGCLYQVYLSRWVELYLRRLRSPLGRNLQCEAAVKEAVTSESEIFRQSPTKGQYLSLSTRALARAESEVKVEIHEVSDIGEGEGEAEKRREESLVVERALVATGLVGSSPIRDDDGGDLLPLGESGDCTSEAKSELPEIKTDPFETKLEAPETSIETCKTETKPYEIKSELLETKLKAPEGKSEAPKAKLEAPETELEPLDTHLPDSPASSPSRDLVGPSTSTDVVENLSSNPSVPVLDVADCRNLEEEESKTAESKQGKCGLETKEDIEDIEKRMEKVRAEIDLQHSLAMEEWREETWTETNPLPSVKFPRENCVLLDEKTKKGSKVEKKREQHAKGDSEAAKVSQKDHRVKKTFDESNLKTMKDDSSRNWSVQEKVKSYVKEYLKPLVRSGVVTVEQCKWAVEKTASKVLQHHRGTESAEFLIKEGASVRKLAEQYLGTWRARPSVT